MAYWSMVFAAAFALGLVRTLWLAPRIGDLAAVACEVPITLAISWWAAHKVITRWRIAESSDALALGLIAFAVLMVAEIVLARLLTGLSAGEWAASLMSGAGALGLGGQVLFALIPWMAVKRG
jgi:hypothetical protein